MEESSEALRTAGSQKIFAKLKILEGDNVLAIFVGWCLITVEEGSTMSPFFPIPIELVHREFTKQMMAQLAIVHAVVEMNTHMLTQFSWVFSRFLTAPR